MGAEIEQLTVQEQGLKKRYELLQAEEAELTVTSPIAGQVITWDPVELLATRPVERGQLLMTVADTAGPWVLEVLLPDRHAGDVLEARQQLGNALSVSFILATDPAVTYTGQIKEVSMSTEEDEEQGSALLVTVAVDRAAIGTLRPGATVVAKIDCGPRSIGYVWLHELIRFVQAKILFKL